MESVQTRMRELLTDVAHAVKGPPAAGERHDWGDLPELVHKLATEHRHLKAWWAEHMSRVSEGYDQVAVDLEGVRRDALSEGYRRGVVDTIHRFEGRLRELPEAEAVDFEELA